MIIEKESNMFVYFSILAVPLLIYIVLQMSGPRSPSILISVSERASLLARFSENFKRFAVVSNIGASLTSLATVYVFFIGTSKLFGYFVYIAVFSAALSPYLAAKITTSMRKNKEFKTRIDIESPSAAILPSLFWCEKNRSHSALVKWIQITALFSVIWLELTVFNKMLFPAIGLQDSSIFIQMFIFFLSTFLITHFVVRYGVRGFAFSDIICFPILLVGIFVLLIVVIYGNSHTVFQDGIISTLLPSPIFSIFNCIIFGAAAIFLNTFLIVSTEAHWLRVWLFPHKEEDTKFWAGWLTGFTWLPLVLIGFVAIDLSPNFGWQATLDIVDFSSQQADVVIIFFWLAVTAAIFSTADTQAYSILLLLSFSPKTGTSELAKISAASPALVALPPAVILTIVFALVESLTLPFEQIVFFILPFFLCVTPSIVSSAMSIPIQNWPVVLSVFGYLLFGLLMIAIPQHGFLWSLAAPLFPALVCAYIILKHRMEKRFA